MVLSGCSTQHRVLNTLMESKAGSVGEWKNRKLDGAPLLDTVTMNTALLLSPADGLEVNPSMDGDLLTVPAFGDLGLFRIQGE